VVPFLDHLIEEEQPPIRKQPRMQSINIRLEGPEGKLESRISMQQIARWEAVVETDMEDSEDSKGQELVEAMDRMHLIWDVACENPSPYKRILHKTKRMIDAYFERLIALY
jgi:hypothetical protein